MLVLVVSVGVACLCALFVDLLTRWSWLRLLVSCDLVAICFGLVCVCSLFTIGYAFSLN